MSEGISTPLERPPDGAVEKKERSRRPFRYCSDAGNHNQERHVTQGDHDLAIEAMITCVGVDALELLQIDRRLARQAYERVGLLIAERSEAAVTQLETQRGLRRMA